MDKGPSEEVIPEIPGLIFPQTTDWDTWYKFIHEELIKHITRINSHIRLLEIYFKKANQLNDANGKMVIHSEIMSLAQIVTLNSLGDFIVQFQNELRKQFETSEKQISELTDMLVPLEPYLPQLKKFAEEKRKEDEEKAKWK